MAVSFAVSSYSFLQLLTDAVKEPTGCAEGQTLCLPVLYLKDLKFQLIAEVTDDDKTWFNQTVSGSLHKVSVGVSQYNCSPLPLTPPSPINYEANWVRIKEGESWEPDTWIGNFMHNNLQHGWDTDPMGWGMVAPGTCFNLNIYRCYSGFTGNVTEYLACFDTCLQRITDACDTSVIEYACNENAFEFYYSGENTNKVRLPFYLRNMQLSGEEKSYQKSDGSKIKLYERINEEYEVKIDYMRKEWHKRLKVAFAHDYIYIQNLNEMSSGAQMQFICTEKYEIDWPDMKYTLASAKTKVMRAEAVYLHNSNCK